MKEKKERVAIIGSGLAGLTTAYLLHHDKESRFSVRIFESGETLSLDGASVDVTDHESKAKTRVDVPMRAFAGGYYLRLAALYRHLQMKWKAQQFLFAFSRKDDSKGAHFIHSSNNHRIPPIRPPGQGWVTFLLQTFLVWAVYRYYTFCCFWFPPHSTSTKTETLRQYAKRICLPAFFLDNFLLPLISSVTTCPHEALAEFPAIDLVNYKRAVHREQHYVVEGGVGAVQQRLAKGIQVDFQKTVTKVKNVRSEILIEWIDFEGRTGSEYFDQVVIAVNPVAVGKIYEPLRDDMESIPCCEVEVIVHRDARAVLNILPAARGLQEEKAHLLGSSCVAQLKKIDSILQPGSADVIQLQTSPPISDNVNSRISTLKKPLCSSITEATHIHAPGVLVTTMPLTPIAPEFVEGSTRFTRVLRNPESREIVNRIFRKSGGSGWRNGDDGVWLVGGWCWDGMVLLEGCVVSAERVAREKGVRIPWD